MTNFEVQAKLDAARAETDLISSEIHRLMSVGGFHRAGRREALKAALDRYNVVADEYGTLAYNYYALMS